MVPLLTSTPHPSPTTRDTSGVKVRPPPTPPTPPTSVGKEYPVREADRDWVNVHTVRGLTQRVGVEEDVTESSEIEQGNG